MNSEPHDHPASLSAAVSSAGWAGGRLLCQPSHALPARAPAATLKPHRRSSHGHTQSPVTGESDPSPTPQKLDPPFALCPVKLRVSRRSCRGCRLEDPAHFLISTLAGGLRF